MNYKKLSVTFIFICLLTSAFSQSKKKMSRLIDDSFAYANEQYRYMMTQLPNGEEMPQRFNFTTGKIEAGSQGRTWWCSGFYPGSLVYIYEQTKDPVIWEETQRALAYIEPNKHYTGNHDLGFMMYNSFGNAYRVAPQPSYKEAVFTAAESLAKRYIPTVKATQSWGDYVKRKEVPVIIDNMLNLELLLWVTQEGGDPKYREMAINHANTTLANHFRPDYSSYHVVAYDRETGNVVKKHTHQGYSDDSAWARGQAWGLYGYTMMYRFTKDERYLDQANAIANFILNHPNLPKDKVPYWDFDAPDIPNTVRDASAGALIASALLELGQYVDKKNSKKYVRNAADILQSLSSPAYRPEVGTTGGFLLLHSTGAFPLNSEIDVPLIYADYYYLEALKRYKDWYL